VSGDKFCVSVEFRLAGKCVLTTGPLCLQVRDRELEQNDEETRPLSDGSAYEQRLSGSVRKREKASPQQQVCGFILVLTVLCREILVQNSLCDLTGFVYIYLYVNLALVLSDGFYFKNCSPVKSGGCCWASGTCDTGGLESNKLLIRMAGLKCGILYNYVALLLTLIS